MVPCLVVLTDLQMRRVGLSASSELPVDLSSAKHSNTQTHTQLRKHNLLENYRGTVHSCQQIGPTIWSDKTFVDQHVGHTENFVDRHVGPTNRRY